LQTVVQLATEILNISWAIQVSGSQQILLGY